MSDGRVDGARPILAPAERTPERVEGPPSGTLWWDAFARLRRNRMAMAAGMAVIVIALLATCAPLICAYGPIGVDATSAQKPPSALHPFGTDQFGRDILT